jgi:hypothetical protein
MNLEELQNMWAEDCIIDDNHLDRESVNTAKLHSKYLNNLIAFKLKLAKMRADYNNLRQHKFRFYRGELSREELTLLGWEQWQGIKPLKNEMEEFLGGDNDLNNLDIKVQYIQSVVEFLESIMNQIKARDWQIRNSIEWKKFISGA